MAHCTLGRPKSVPSIRSSSRIGPATLLQLPERTRWGGVGEGDLLDLFLKKISQQRDFSSTRHEARGLGGFLVIHPNTFERPAFPNLMGWGGSLPRFGGAKGLTKPDSIGHRSVRAQLSDWYFHDGDHAGASALRTTLVYEV